MMYSVVDAFQVTFQAVQNISSFSGVMTTIPAISKAALERRFIESGERDRMRELLLQRLRESGWVEDVENMCRSFIQTKVSPFLP
ncbi:unnamed protein product [Gongylonema pulchrum]|uniref:Transcription and mRNA export factor ENY2 n=1 Tax=Gongylonema pulchrum TaxID=637853 RepID=A0A183ER58_9BILA|nr:unnamed protein product [Gongylonema pulchrum]